MKLQEKSRRLHSNMSIMDPQAISWLSQNGLHRGAGHLSYDQWSAVSQLSTNASSSWHVIPLSSSIGPAAILPARPSTSGAAARRSPLAGGRGRPK